MAKAKKVQTESKQQKMQLYFQRAVTSLASEFAFTKKPLDLLKEGWKHAGNGTADQMGWKINLQGTNFMGSPYTGHKKNEQGQIVLNKVPEGLIGVWQAPPKFISGIQQMVKKNMASLDFDQ